MITVHSVTVATKQLLNCLIDWVELVSQFSSGFRSITMYSHHAKEYATVFFESCVWVCGYVFFSKIDASYHYFRLSHIREGTRRAREMSSLVPPPLGGVIRPRRWSEEPD